jgi:hypothetical protein
MIYVQLFFLKENNDFLTVFNNKINTNNFIKMAKYSNYLLNKTGKKVHFWGNKRTINMFKSLGFIYDEYHEIPEKYEELLINSTVPSLAQLMVASLQTEDFYMVDLDVLLFDEEKLPKIKEKTFYISHQELFWAPTKNEFLDMIELMCSKFKIHNILYKNISNQIKKNLTMYNAGIMGGNGKLLSPIFKELLDFYIKYIINKTSIECEDNELSDILSYILFIQTYAPIYMKNKGFYLKTIYENNDLFEKNIVKLNFISKEIIGMAHLLGDHKNDPKNFEEIE